MKPLAIPTVSIERTLKFWFMATLIVLFLGYATYQARNLIQGPSITLMNELGTIQPERGVILTGIAKNIVVLRLNGREIHTNEEGLFEHTVTLESGYTILTLEAEDRYGRQTYITRSFVYTPNS